MIFLIFFQFLSFFHFCRFFFNHFLQLLCEFCDLVLFIWFLSNCQFGIFCFVVFQLNVISFSCDFANSCAFSLFCWTVFVVFLTFFVLLMVDYASIYCTFFIVLKFLQYFFFIFLFIYCQKLQKTVRIGAQRILLHRL